MTKRPLFLAGLVYLAGTAVAFSASMPCLWMLFALCMALLFLMKQPKEKGLILLLCAMVLLSFLAVEKQQKQREQLLTYSGQSCRVEGTILESRILAGSVYYELEADFGRSSVPLALFSSEMEAFAAGERVRAIVSLEENDYHGQTAMLLSGNVQEMQSLGEDKSLRAECLRLRTGIQQRIDRLFSGKSREVLSGILLGEKAQLSEELEEVFQKSGCAHLLTVSGFHISMMSAGIFGLFQLLRQNPRRAAVLTLPLLLILAMIQGMTVSVCRAAIMAALSYFALILQRDYDGLSAWVVAVVAVLLHNPMLLFSKSFLLSYSAVLGILLFYGPISKGIFTFLVLPDAGSIANRILFRIGSVIALSLSANLLSAGFLLYFFGYIPVMTLFSSPVAFTLLPVLMGFAAAAVVMPWDILASILAEIAQLLCGLLYGSLRFFAKLDWNIYGQEDGILLMLLLFELLLLLLTVKKQKARRLLPLLYGYVCACILLWNLFSYFKLPQPQIIACRRALTLSYDGRAVVVGIIEKESDRKEIEKILQTQQVKQLDLFCVTGEPKDDGIQSLQFVQRWQPALTASVVELDAFRLTNTAYQQGLQEIHFWEDWKLSVKEDRAILTNAHRKVLKVHEKYDIMIDKTEMPSAVFGDEDLFWAEEALAPDKTWDGQWRITVKQED